jgi:hypothetical protein
LRYAKVHDRLLVEEGKKQRYGTQWDFENSDRVHHPIKAPEYEDKRRTEIGLDPLKVHLRERFDIESNVGLK